MNETLIKEKLLEAIHNLLEKQLDLFSFASGTTQTEWNISQHLGNEIQKLFPDYRYDPELRKPDAGGRRPDIVLHQRGTHAHNFLVVEVKRNKREVQSEINKIKEYWFKEPYKYRFGAVVVIDEQDNPIEVITNTDPTVLSSVL
jgi:hypothetical protein